ncbi:ABC transporter permease [Subtercola endophyticus]|uniref:ABC transporter permease n=1 Tax=Subtercola endophyticus TaxID=2895559 RepID=UPI001E5C46A7|nr:ABC transporter permease [Subtercola endophyticus]UFS57517.1 ABC transporter permease [Subtercola endophyticus]
MSGSAKSASGSAQSTGASASSAGGSAQSLERKPRVSAYRRWYSTLHPSLQLIGLQLWLPLFFIVAFCLCYIAAFHSPHPHDVPVGVVGSSSEQLQTEFDTALPGVLSVRSFDTVEEAKAAVTTGQVAVAFDPSTSTIYKASAHQYQVAALLPAMITPVLAARAATGAPVPTVVDLAPLPSYDEYGTVSLYLMLAWCIGGYMVAMFIGLMGAPLKHRTRIAVIVVGGALISLITNVLAGPVIGAVHGHFGALFLIAWGWIVAIGLTVNGASYFAGRFIAVPAMVVFIFLSMPSSGAAYPSWFMPEPFAWLNNVVVGSGITEMLKRVLYGVGPGCARGITMMVSYAVVGLVLMFVGKHYLEWRRVKRVTSGRTTMFADANAANREFLIRQRDETLAKHHLVRTDTGTITTIPPEELAQLTPAAPSARAADEFDPEFDAHFDTDFDAEFDDSTSPNMFLGSSSGLEGEDPPSNRP